MADPLSICASAIAVITAAVQSIQSLYATVESYRGRNKTLARLQDGLQDLISVLGSLQEAVGTDVSIVKLLESPVARCGQIARDFEAAMKTFSGKPKSGFRDWAKMEFRKDDIHGFIDTLAGYKSTISIGLGTITMFVIRLAC